MPAAALTIALAVAAMLAALPVPPAAAEVHRPWCANYYGGYDGGTSNCGFVSYEQCMMTARGNGAMCVPNPWYQGSGDRSQPQAPAARPRAR